MLHAGGELFASQPPVLSPPGPQPVQVVIATQSVTQPHATQPIAMQPIATQPIATQPIAAQPIAAQPIAAQPLAMQPIATQPIATQPTITQSVASQPSHGPHRTYARPLAPSYGKAYADTNDNKLRPPTFVAVLDDYYAGQWSIQSVALPIPILANPQGARLLMCSTHLTDADCHELHDHATMVTPITQPPFVKSIDLTKSADDPTLWPVSPPAVPKPLRHINPVKPRPALVALMGKFPGKYFEEMDQRLARFKDFCGPGRRPHQARENRFALIFPGCVYKKSTFALHLKKWYDGLQLGLLNKYREDSEALWVTFVKEVDELTANSTSPSPKPELSSPKPILSREVIELTDSDDDKENEDDINDRFNVVLANITTYLHNADTRAISDYSPVEDHDVEVLIDSNPAYQGKLMNVYMGKCGFGKITGEYVVLKALHNRDGGADLWFEGACMTFARFSSSDFKYDCRMANIDVFDFEFAATYGVCCGRSEWMMSPYISGIPYTTKKDMTSSLVQHKETGLQYETLQAFQHFVYHGSKGAMVHIDFQGYLTSDGRKYTIIDCITCSDTQVDPDVLTCSRNGGSYDIEYFVTKHICNSICMGLSLPNLTDVKFDSVTFWDSD
ncbi:hypothetical protein DXG01_000460 [Tephrocybe rancida]|nr:hypothetical protein DXG01_000460 [Tephrocybe rancida]